MKEVFCLSVTKNSLSENKNYIRWTIKKDSLIIITKKDKYKLKFLLNRYPIFLIFIIGQNFSVFKLYDIKIRDLIYVCK